MYEQIIADYTDEIVIILNNQLEIVYFNKKAKNSFNGIKNNIMFSQVTKNSESELLRLEEYLQNEFKNKKRYIICLDNQYFHLNIKRVENSLIYIEMNDFQVDKSLNIKKDSIYYKTVLNSSDSIILVTNGDKIKKINKRFFEIFDFKDFDNFKSKHNCICELFINKEPNYLIAYKNGKSWLEQIHFKKSKKIKNSINKVCMIDKEGKERVFQVESSGKIFKNEKEELVTFTEITLLIENRKIIQEQSKHAAMGEMIAMIAHQWKQPLTTLTTIYAKMNTLKQLNKLSNEEFDIAYEKSNKIIEHLSTTINDFRNFFHKNSKEEDIMLCDLINKSYELFEIDLKNKGIKFHIKYRNNTEKLSLKIDTSKVTQILLNLIKNAFDVLNEKDIENKFIIVICDILKTNKLLISVEDNGGGVNQEYINKIFEPYFSTKDKKGTGLGLYMCKLIVQEHLKGDLSVQNTNDGAQFTMKIPIKKTIEEK